MNAAKRQALQDDVDRFLQTGGKIEVLGQRDKPTLLAAMQKNAYPEYGPPSKRKAARAKKELPPPVEADVDDAPSRVTPNEQLDIEVDCG
jgi:hypothetical protein